MPKTYAISVAICASVAAVWTPAAFAGQGMDASTVAEHIFAKTDTDNDGAVTPAEYTAAGLGKYGVSFENFDADKNELITLAEYRTLFVKFHEGMGSSDA